MAKQSSNNKSKKQKAVKNPDVEQIAYVLQICLDNLEEQLDDAYEQLEEINNSKVQVENAIVALHTLVNTTKK